MKQEPTVQEIFDLTGRVALVTGGMGHLGSAMARALAEAGATVVISSRDQGRAQASAADLPKRGQLQHYGVALGYMDSASIERGFAKVLLAA